jgi:hypothetical protein
MPSRNIQLQRIYERACEVRLSAPVGQKLDVEVGLTEDPGKVSLL